MILSQTRYRLRAGESTRIDAPRETLDFLARAKTRRVEIAGNGGGRGFVFGPNATGDQVMLAAYLALKPGEYRARLSASSGSGEERATMIDITLRPMETVPVNAIQPPVILINGWQSSCPVLPLTSPPSQSTFGYLEGYLTQFDEVPLVYWFDNCAACPDCSIEELGSDLAQVIGSIQYDNGAPVLQVDLIAHSMGGLIVRSYLSGKQMTSGVFDPPNDPRVRKAIFIAAPHFGSYQAGVADLFLGGVQASEMTLGSQFLFDLATWNQFGDDLRGTDALAIIGNAVLGNQGDGVVSLTSAALRFAEPGVRTRIVGYCHITFNLAEALLTGCYDPGIAYIDSTSHYTYQIIQSFLANNTYWEATGTSPSQDQYLSVNGGLLLANRNASNQYFTDLSSVTATNANLSLALGPSNPVASLFYNEWVPANTYDFAMWSGVSETPTGTLTSGAGGGTATFLKEGPLIFSVQSSASSSLPGRIVQTGGMINISGSGFGQQCSGCQVVGAVPGSATGYILPVSSWSDQAISASFLPATMPNLTIPGLITVYVELSSSAWDSINIMTAAPVSTVAVAPTSLQYAFTVGGTTPSAQSIQITNGGGGTLSWSASTSESWLTVSPTSGVAPSAISLSISPAGLSAGTYSGNVQILAAGGASGSVTVAVTLTIAAAPPTLAVSPQALTFSYSAGGAVPAAQSVAITNSGGSTLSWAASPGASWVMLSSASGTAPATLSVSVDPAGMAAGTYAASVQITASGATTSPASVGLTLVVQAAQPVVNVASVTNGASFQPSFASATWVSIFGTGLSESSRGWQASDFVNGLLPTSLDGVSVTIDGLPAYVQYISPTQINVLAPDDATVGTMQVQVSTAQGKSNSFPVQKQQFGPAFFTVGGNFVAALHADYTIVGKAGLIPGVATQPAQPGEVILLYATGFGPTDPPLPAAQLVAAPAALANPVQIAIGGVAAPVAYAGLVGAGLYQFNVTVPNVASGDAAVLAQIGGLQTQTGVLITIR